MRLIITILIALTICIPRLSAQDAIDKKLLALEQQQYACKTDSGKAVLLLSKLDIYIAASIYSSAALREAKRIDYALLQSTESKKRFLWNAALLAHMNLDVDYSRFYYTHYQESFPDSAIPARLLKILIENRNDTAAVSAMVNDLAKKDSITTCLTCLNKVFGYERKHRALYMLSSAFVPGLGSILNGNPVKGMSSLLINGTIGYGIYALVASNEYLNAILLGASVGLQFYTGNIKLTGRLFDTTESRKKNMLANNCEHELEKVFLKYPLSFR
jgi:TM2 domain-containing membrane protein YozV